MASVSAAGVAALAAVLDGLEPHLIEIPYLHLGDDEYIYRFRVEKERNRGIYVLKSRGMAHSNQVREFVLTGKGIELVDIYRNASGSFMGSARLAQMAADKAADAVRLEDIASRERQLDEKRRAVEASIASLRADFEAEVKETEMFIAQEKARENAIASER